MTFERIWYDQVKIFVPHPELWSRHVGMELFSSLSQASRPSPKQFSKASGQSRYDDFAHRSFQIRAHINQSWKPNPTLFVSDQSYWLFVLNSVLRTPLTQAFHISTSILSTLQDISIFSTSDLVSIPLPTLICPKPLRWEILSICSRRLRRHCPLSKIK